MPDVIKSLSPAHRVLHLTEVDSTNAEALRRAVAGERGPLWLIADVQHQGRGRSGRGWRSERGNLFASLLLVLDHPPRVAQQLALVAGVVVVEAIGAAGSAVGSAGPAGLRLKWPNDILIGAAKTGGILIESTTIGGRLAVVIGIGVNLASHPDDHRLTTCLEAHGLAIAPRQFLAHLAAAMDRWLTAWQDGAGFAAVRAAWLARAGALGEPLSINTARGPVKGVFAGLDEAGALLIRDADGSERRFTYGDVTLGGDMAGKDGR